MDAMTTPHEEEWVTGEGALSEALYSGDTWVGSFTRPERAKLAREAPRMARALLAELVVDGAHTVDCAAPLIGAGHPCTIRCERIRTTLLSAGVPIP
jgi:hypothetical protein